MTLSEQHPVLGIIGGIGPESTIAYYRALNTSWRADRPGEPIPRIVINSLDVSTLLRIAGSGDRQALLDYLFPAVEALAAAGATFALLASNTPHLVFDELQAKSTMPLLSIVDAARDEAQSRGLRRLALFGTRFTMQASFYPTTFSASGMEIVLPHSDEIDFVHQKYVDELVPGIIRDETRDGLVAIIERMKHRDAIDGVLLGGTELPLILDQPVVHGLPLLDTTQIHVRAALERLGS